MREVLYRSKPLNLDAYSDHIRDGISWVYGCPLVNPFHPNPLHGVSVQIFEQRDGKMFNWECDPETLGQWMGIRDKNGKKIFEGDIVRCEDTRYEFTREFRGIVVYKNGAFAINDDEITRYRLIDYEMEVIGNIHDNPELLKE